MTAVDATALREYVATLPTSPLNDRTIGVMEMVRAAEGPYITHAGRCIAVTLDFVAVADEMWFGFDAGVLTFRAINRTVQYRVVGLGWAWPTEVVVCEQIEEADA